MEAQYRLSGSVSLSVIIHIFLLLGYLGLGALDQPSEPPIREITFIDMNEVEEEPEETVVKREAPPPVRREVPPPRPEEEMSTEPAQQQTRPTIARRSQLCHARKRAIIVEAVPIATMGGQS